MSPETREKLEALADEFYPESVYTRLIRILIADDTDAKPDVDDTALLDSYSRVLETVRVTLNTQPGEDVRITAERVMRELADARTEVERLKAEHRSALHNASFAIRNAALDEAIAAVFTFFGYPADKGAFSYFAPPLTERLHALKTPPPADVPAAHATKHVASKPGSKSKRAYTEAEVGPLIVELNTYTEANLRLTEKLEAAAKDIARLTAERDGAWNAAINACIPRVAGWGNKGLVENLLRPNAPVLVDASEVAKAVEAEREECAKECEEWCKYDHSYLDGKRTCKAIAGCIRARSKQ